MVSNSHLQNQDDPILAELREEILAAKAAEQRRQQQLQHPEIKAEFVNLISMIGGELREWKTSVSDDDPFFNQIWADTGLTPETAADLVLLEIMSFLMQTNIGLDDMERLRLNGLSLSAANEWLE